MSFYPQTEQSDEALSQEHRGYGGEDVTHGLWLRAVFNLVLKAIHTCLGVSLLHFSDWLK